MHRRCAEAKDQVEDNKRQDVEEACVRSESDGVHVQRRDANGKGTREIA